MTGFFDTPSGPSKRIAIFVHSASSPITYAKVYQNVIMPSSLWGMDIITEWPTIMLGPVSAYDAIYLSNLKEAFEALNGYESFTTITVLKDVVAVGDVDAYKKFSLVYKIPIVAADGSLLNVHLLSEPVVAATDPATGA